MSIRSKKPAQAEEVKVEEVAAPIQPQEAETEQDVSDTVKVKAAAKLASSKQAVYRLLTPYSIVSPKGVRFLPGEPVAHPVDNWMESNVAAKILEVVE